MFSRLSATSRIIVLQAAIIVSMILFAGLTLRITGHGRKDAASRLAGEPGYMPPRLATWTRDNGWMLFAIPVGWVVFAAWRKQRFGDEYESAAIVTIGFVIAGGLFIFGVAAGLEPFGLRLR